ncbi:hypothetical protein N8A98_02185 (plasmid) [Devosia neptuniae]|uniref:Uncharacterized protein n=1 Tax=Devosia neptuniae TaxID=191302 RepID=A0ABY6C6X0_9HYPH|nr:hypothetical protein [Devosia neptuniae]UXN67889.1 hypothetical protein N8A98_02185 [Devosia neptuniae]
MSREVRRTVAQFLNGVALSILVVGAIGPMAAATAILPSVAVAIAISLSLHGLALLVPPSEDAVWLGSNVHFHIRRLWSAMS